MNRKVKVLMTGAGAPGGPGIIKALLKEPNIELIVCDADEMASGRFLGIPFFKVPKAMDEKFIDSIIDICINNEIQVVFPLVTLELFRFSSSKVQFKELGIEVIVSEESFLNIANNKRKLLDHLSTKGILVPEYRVATSITELENASRDLNYPNNEVVIKPSVSNGSRGVRILSEKISEYDLLFNEKPGNLFSNLSKIKDVLSDNYFPELIISEYLPGDEYTIDTIVRNGQVKIILPRKRVKMNGGISVAGKFVKNDRIIDYCIEIIESMHLEGPIGVQVKEDREGNFKILEINPRIQGTSVAALGAGINLPVLSIFNALNTANFKLPINWNAGFVRHYEELFYYDL
jgi:carbamoyl-phosphate synthase large subunit